MRERDRNWLRKSGQRAEEALCPLPRKGLEQPRLAVGPVSFRGGGGNAQGGGGFFDGQSGEVAEFDEFGLLRLDRGELVECLVERDEVFDGFGRGDGQFVGVVAVQFAAVLGGLLSARG